MSARAKACHENLAARQIGLDHPDPELTDDLHPERLLRFNKFPVEQIDQHIPLPRMQRVLPQLNNGAAIFQRQLRVRILHREGLRREWNRRHQEFQCAQDWHYRIKWIADYCFQICRRR